MSDVAFNCTQWVFMPLYFLLMMILDTVGMTQFKLKT